MKGREGFVSNSSSSSFVFRVGHPFRDVFELALRMIPIRDWTEEEMEAGAMNDEKTLTKLMALDMDPNTPLTFASCNEDTHILKVDTEKDSYLVVQTCHNHRFDEIEGSLNGYPSDLVKELKRLADSNPIERGSGKTSSWCEDERHCVVWEWIGCFLDEMSEYWSVERGMFVPKGWSRWDEEFEKRRKEEEAEEARRKAKRVSILTSRIPDLASRTRTMEA